MIRYNKQVIYNSITSAMAEGYSTGDALDYFLSMKMENDLCDEDHKQYDSLSPHSIYMNLIGNDVIDKHDYRIVYSNDIYKTPRLQVTLSPFCTLYAELARGSLKITINDKQLTTITLRHHRIPEVAMWMIRQKQNLDAYMAEWEDVLKKSSKKTKSNRMSLLAIKAIFTDAVKDYPDLKYEFIEQKRRMRIKVKLPNSKLGVYLDAWWGTYKEKLPPQIEDLKALIQAHSNISIINFYITKQ